MGRRLRALALFVVLLAAGVFLGSALSQWWGGTGTAEGVLPSILPLVRERVRVEVLNAGGVPGVARSATEVLRDRGFDVVYLGNAGTFSADSSVVLDRVGRLEDARLAADALGIRRVMTEPDSNLFVDLTVRLGPEWALPAPPSDSPASASRPWWDLRRFLPAKDTSRADTGKKS